MTDRQMLEDAARAAGMVIEWKEGHCKGGPYAGAFVNGVAWRPREDDGDALRLAVKCSLSPSIFTDGTLPGTRVTMVSATNLPWAECYAEELHGNDPYAATRLAITRAAASIGAKMREEGHG